MTGFVEKKFVYKTFSVRIAIKSLNHRYFDWNFRGGNLGEVEGRLRSICQRELHRGRIEVHLDFRFYDPSRWELQINEELLSTILSSFERISSRLGKEISLSWDNLFTIPHLTELRRKNFTPDEIKHLEKCFMDTLSELIKVRRREGRQLKSEIRGHVGTISQSVRRIDKLGKKQPSFIREKIKERFQELEDRSIISEEKLIEETAYIAQRYDISEEIARMKSHLAYLRELLTTNESEPVGKKLDFLAQELFREANTINSKAQDLSIIKESLTVKSELESIRQQVQNLE
jgi:uncharacterized protein (TIGR00255 family)